MKNITSSTSRTENARTKKLLSELREKSPLPSYELQIEENYHSNKLKPAISIRQASEAAINFIIEKNTSNISYTRKSQQDELMPDSKHITFTPRRKDIQILKRDVVIIPRWSIEFESSKSTYRREILACSGVVLEDTMAYCPNHFRLGSVEFSKKQSVAVCEVCGKALCGDHVGQCAVCGKWLCENDSFHCEVCKNRFCIEHEHNRCSVCGGQICVSCLATCPICHTAFSPNHSITCDKCQQSFCPTCVITSGLIRKNRLCRNCAGET